MKIQLIPFDGDNPEHTKLLYQIGKESGAELWDERHRDPILFISTLCRQLTPEHPKHFIVEYNGQLGGYLAVILDVYRIAYIEAAGLKKFRSFYPARQALLMLARYCFESLRAHKLKCQIPVFNRSAEAVARSIGFRKEGISKRELRFNGRLTDLLELALFPEYLEEKCNRKRLKQALKGARR